MIKKLLLSASFGLLFFVSNAQFKKGSVLLGGDVGFGRQKSTEGSIFSNSSNFSFSPTVGIASKDNFFQGIQLNFISSKSDYSSTNGNKSSSYGAAYFLRKYKSIFGKFSGFIQAGVWGDFRKTQERGFVVWDMNTFTASLSISPGINFPITKNVYLETGFSNIASVYYQSSKRESSGGSTLTSKANSFGVSTNLSASGNGLYFGFRIILPK
jgi:hypothetical protein